MRMAQPDFFNVPFSIISISLTTNKAPLLYNLVWAQIVGNDFKPPPILFAKL